MSIHLTIRPTVGVSCRASGCTTVTVQIEFDDFDKAIEFNELIVAFLKRELPLLTMQQGQTSG